LFAPGHAPEKNVKPVNKKRQKKVEEKRDSINGDGLERTLGRKTERQPHKPYKSTDKERGQGGWDERRAKSDCMPKREQKHMKW